MAELPDGQSELLAEEAGRLEQLKSKFKSKYETASDSIKQKKQEMRSAIGQKASQTRESISRLNLTGEPDPELEDILPARREMRAAREKHMNIQRIANSGECPCCNFGNIADVSVNENEALQEMREQYGEEGIALAAGIGPEGSINAGEATSISEQIGMSTPAQIRSCSSAPDCPMKLKHTEKKLAAGAEFLGIKPEVEPPKTVREAASNLGIDPDELDAADTDDSQVSDREGFDAPADDPTNDNSSPNQESPSVTDQGPDPLN